MILVSSFDIPSGFRLEKITEECPFQGPVFFGLVNFFNTSYQSILGSSCNSGEKCRSYSACAAQNSLQNSRVCKQKDGSNGLCCRTITKNIQSKD